MAILSFLFLDLNRSVRAERGFSSVGLNLVSYSSLPFMQNMTTHAAIKLVSPTWAPTAREVTILVAPRATLVCRLGK